MIKRIRVNTDKIITDKYLLVVSDIHKTKDLDKDNLSLFNKQLKRIKYPIDYILIVGDIINDTEDLLDIDFQNRFRKEMIEFLKDYKTIISLGNHDEATKVEKNNIFKNKAKQGDFTILKEILTSIDNVSLLDNNSIYQDESICFASFNPNLNYYIKYYGEKSEFLRQFLKDYTDKFNKNMFNILLCHDPESIIKLSELEGKCIQPNTDIVVSGHMHNGFLPPMLNFIVKNRGIISPTKSYFPKYAHGEVDIDNTKFIINGAINSRVENKIINYLYGPNATMIELKKVIKR